MRFVKLCLGRLLARYVRQFFRTNSHIKLVAVVGSVGKTSTKSTIVDLLTTKYRVRTNRGNFNAALSAPLEILAVESPANPRRLADWIDVVKKARMSARQHHDIDIVVQEFGIDHPGEMAQFARYLQPDITVVTAISPEHMEFFGNLTTVAQEEFGLSHVSRKTLYNKEDIRPEFATCATSPVVMSYGTSEEATYRMRAGTFQPGRGFACQFTYADHASQPFVMPVIGIHQLRIAAGAAAVALELGVSMKMVVRSLARFRAVAGRMSILPGMKGATIIDDTYNASPLAVTSALETLYRLPTKRKIAVLGDMNELGKMTQLEHEAIGKLCDPKKLYCVVTVGPLAQQFLAPAATQRGCRVLSFATALQAVPTLKKLTGQDAVFLFKGSQGGIYLEEAVKPLLKNPHDASKLVRQSAEWLQRKQAFFDQKS